jgi:uncharacterized membrane protein
LTLPSGSVAFAWIFVWTLLRERPLLRSALGVFLVLVDTLWLGKEFFSVLVDSLRSMLQKL